MKWTLQAVLLIALFLPGKVKAQEHYTALKADGADLINIADDGVKKHFTAPPENISILKSARTPNSSITVTYHNFPESAKKAFDYSVQIWESVLESSVTINIEAHWENLPDRVLAKGRPSVFYSNFNGAPLTNTYYPVALAEKLCKRELNPGEPDIICSFNKNISWYFGTDGNTPATQYDFVSSVLHEVAHGLGFSGFFKNADGKGFFNNNNNQPSVYDVFIFNSLNQKISDKKLFQSPSLELSRQITSDKLKFAQAATENQFYTVDQIYAPQVWNEGSSIYHLKSSPDNEKTNLMSHAAKKGLAIHNPGKATMEILAELGWETTILDFEPLKDIEKPVAELPVMLKINSDNVNEISSVKVVFSAENKTKSNSAILIRKDNSRNFEGELPLQYATGEVRYYFEAKTSEGRIIIEPSGAPSKSHTLRIGPDYYIPDLFHNPVKSVSCNSGEIELPACATDNVGIKKVYAEYKINGVVQEPVQFEKKGDDLYSVRIKSDYKSCNRFEYRITAVDDAERENKRSFPNIGFQQIKIYSPDNSLPGYQTDFSNAANDFVLSDFQISSVSNMAGTWLHTQNPYPVSSVKQEHYNMTATLKHPVIIQPNGTMSFDEIVLTEPGSREKYPRLYDYVVVEASKDGGYSWNPITKYYDAGENDTWYSAFGNNFSNLTSAAKPHKNMLKSHTINLTRNTGLTAGDTVLFRFRMSSDNSVNGYGWVIGNLEIQGLSTSNKELMAKTGGKVYPNPATDRLYIDLPEPAGHENIEITLSDLYGKVVIKKNETFIFNSDRTELDLSAISPGIYIVNINNGKEIISTEKIIKN